MECARKRVGTVIQLPGGLQNAPFGVEGEAAELFKVAETVPGVEARCLATVLGVPFSHVSSFVASSSIGPPRTVGTAQQCAMPTFRTWSDYLGKRCLALARAFDRDHND